MWDLFLTGMVSSTLYAKCHFLIKAYFYRRTVLRTDLSDINLGTSCIWALVGEGLVSASDREQYLIQKSLSLIWRNQLLAR